MKSLPRRSCSGLLLLALFGCLLAFIVFAAIFQQSQATASTAVPSGTAPMTATRPVLPAATTPLLLPSPTTVDDTASSLADVTIQVETMTTAAPLTDDGALTLMPSTPGNNALSTAAPGGNLSNTSTEVPRYSGTSSYPLTVTAEMLLAQTHVAHYQSDVSATRTTIAAESVGIFETLTASAPMPTVERP